MNEQDAGAFPGDFEADRVGGEQVDEQETAEEPAAGEGERAADGEAAAVGRRPREEDLEWHPHKRDAEILADHEPDAYIDLGKRTAEDRDQRRREEHNRDA